MSHWYLTPEEIIRKRYNWFQEAQRLGNISLACKHLGISRKTFYKWHQRFQEATANPNSLLEPKKTLSVAWPGKESQGQKDHQASQED